MQIEHDENRELQVQALSKAIYRISQNWNDYGGTYRCPFCDNFRPYKNIQIGLIMPQISHEDSCPWLIAKNLYARAKK